MKHNDDVKRALATTQYAVLESSGCGDGQSVAEKSAWYLVRIDPGKLELVHYTVSVAPTRSARA